jgi:hypothetical protein
MNTPTFRAGQYSALAMTVLTLVTFGAAMVAACRPRVLIVRGTACRIRFRTSSNTIPGTTSTRAIVRAGQSTMRQ